jgi:Mg-chelatase subunit ChlD
VGYYGSSGCWRSAYNYAREYQRIIEAPPFNQRAFVENRACSGAVTANFDGAQNPDAGVTRQLDWVNTGYDVIFLTIGGNDLSFAEIVKKCLVQGSRDGADCAPLLTNAETLISNGTLEGRIRNVLTSIQERAHPNAKIVLLDYPYLESDATYRLRSGHFASTFIDVGKRIRALSDSGYALEQRVVDDLNATHPNRPFVLADVRSTFNGHELAAQKLNASRWMVEPWEDSGYLWHDWWYHPNRLGHRAEAELLATNPLVPKTDVNGSGSAPSGKLDIVLTIDATGSMGDDIDAVRSNMLQLLHNVEASGADWRMALVTYKDVPPQGDPGDYASRVDLDFTSDPEAVTSALNGIVVGGGGDEAETVLSGIHQAVGLGWRDGAKKAVVVLGDAPPHDPEPASGLTSASVVAEALAVDPAEIYPVLTSTNTFLADTFRPLADGTGGRVLTSDGATDVAAALGEVLSEVARAPIAIAGGPYSVGLGEDLHLSATASSDPDGRIVTYEWDLDNDGIYEHVSDAPTLDVVANTAYDGVISLRVTDDTGLQTVGQTDLLVRESEPTSEEAPPDIPGVLETDVPPDEGPACTIRGTSGTDLLVGTPGPDVICGRGGGDVVFGLGGDDRIITGAGNDLIFAGGGDDQIEPGPGLNIVDGGPGRDGVRLGGATLMIRSEYTL